MGRDDPLRDVLAALAREPAYAGLVLGLVCVLVLLAATRRGEGIAGVWPERAGSLLAGLATLGIIPYVRLWILLPIGVAALAGAEHARADDSRARDAVVLDVAGIVAIALGAGVMRGVLAGGVAAAVSTAGVVLLRDFDRSSPHRRHGVLLVTLTGAGLFGVLPDTEPALVLVGVGLPLLAYGYRPGASAAPLGRMGAAGCAGVIAWTVGIGSAGRPVALIAGSACLGVLLLEPLVRRMVGPRGREAGAQRRHVAVVLIHLALVYTVSRVAGIGRTVDAAALIAAGALVVAALLLAAVGRSGRDGAVR